MHAHGFFNILIINTHLIHKFIEYYADFFKGEDQSCDIVFDLIF